MTRGQAAILVFHGALLLLVGNLAGLPFSVAIEEDWGPDAVRAWRVAHTSLVMGAVLYVAIGAARSYVALPRWAASLLVWLLVGTAYVFSSALFLGASIGARGLAATGGPLHLLVFLGFGFSVSALFAASGLFLWGTCRALRSA